MTAFGYFHAYKRWRECAPSAVRSYATFCYALEHCTFIGKNKLGQDLYKTMGMIIVKDEGYPVTVYPKKRRCTRIRLPERD